MKLEFKISNIRATGVMRDLTESNHISTFILRQPSDLNRIDTNYDTSIIQLHKRTGKLAIILFDIQGITWWCKEAEFSVIKYALENTTKEILLWYVPGSISPFLETPVQSSGIDGYQLNIRFN